MKTKEVRVQVRNGEEAAKAIDAIMSALIEGVDVMQRVERKEAESVDGKVPIEELEAAAANAINDPLKRWLFAYGAAAGASRILAAVFGKLAQLGAAQVEEDLMQPKTGEMVH